jgi:hypothetical protein
MLSTSGARRPYRLAAYAAAVACFGLAAATPYLFAADERLVPAAIFMFAGVMMFVVGVTGYWPPRRG